MPPIGVTPRADLRTDPLCGCIRLGQLTVGNEPPIAEHPHPRQVGGDLDRPSDHVRPDGVVTGVQPDVMVAGQLGPSPPPLGGDEPRHGQHGLLVGTDPRRLGSAQRPPRPRGRPEQVRSRIVALTEFPRLAVRGGLARDRCRVASQIVRQLVVNVALVLAAPRASRPISSAPAPGPYPPRLVRRRKPRGFPCACWRSTLRLTLARSS